MEKNKTKKIKQEKYRTDEQIELTRFVKILIILIVVIGGIYLVSRIFITKDLFNKEVEKETSEEISINYDTAIFGDLFNRPYESYYAFIFNSTNSEAEFYNAVISNYKNSNSNTKVYYVDLNNPLNAKFYDPKNINYTNDFTTLKVGDFTLLKIEKNNIAEHFDNIDDAKKELNL